MDQMTGDLQGAFQKLYRWIQRELKHLSLENPQINAGIRRALRVLAERPTLFQNCLDFFAEARQNILLDSFYTALTGAAPTTVTPSYMDPTTKPIELYAHDPLRYIGDMLAWLHSTAVGEQEALEVLFISQEGEGQNSILGGIEEGLKSEPWLEDGDGEGKGAIRGGWDARKGLMMLVDKDLQTVCKPLKSRIEQVIASHEESTLVYKISNLINFYRLTFEKLLGQESFLLETMKTTEQAALRQFHSSLQEHVRTVQSELPQAPDDLTPPPFLYEALNELKQLMISCGSSLIPDSEREGGFYKILEEALDPYLDGCHNLSQDLEEVDKNIFVINCQLAAKTTLEQFSFTADRISKLDAEVEKQIVLLTEFQHNFFVHTSGLHPLLVALSDWDPKTTPLTQLLPFSPHTLSLVSQTLDEFLPSALMDATTGLKRLSSPKIIGEIMQEAASRFVDDFARVEEVVIDALVNEGDRQGEGRIEFARSVWPRTVDEVRVLLT
ncbi:oligomeric complex COG6 [Tuber magnatum]|uniref:Oligomeric complex COG6 n=1 Tax=Tuber magnatum TaxID=42249 RepID=A0A317T1M6_9PEZI|nr:oligomeric complex COG6 [Tuber magnatum]